MPENQNWKYVASGVVAVASVALVTPASASAAERRLGRGFTEHGTSITGVPAPSHALQAVGQLRLRGIGRGEFNWDFDRGCANPDCSATLNSHSFDFLLPDGAGELFGGNSGAADSASISVQGVGSLAGWGGHIRLVAKPGRHRERILAVGDLHFDPRLRCEYLGVPWPC